MFKDIYKEANDDIKPDPYLLTRILNKSEEKHKPVFSYFRFAPVAALIALAIALPGIISAPEENIGTVLQQPITPTAENSTTYFFLSKDTADDVTYTADNSKLYSGQKVIEADGVSKEESLNATMDLSEMTVVMSVNSVTPTVSTAAYRFSSGGSSEESMEEITAGQYFENIGFSPDILTLPDGLNPDFTADSIVTLTKHDGETVSDENTFTYNGTSYLSVTTSTFTEEAMSYLENNQYEKSVFGDKNAVVLYDGSIYEAYIIHSSGTALKIVTDMPEEDLKNLLISIAK